MDLNSLKLYSPDKATVLPSAVLPSYIPTVERVIGSLRKPIVYMIMAANLLGPLQSRSAYADARLKQGRDACFAEYVKKLPDVLASFENTLKLYTSNVGEGVETVVGAIASPRIGKEIEMHASYGLLKLIADDRDHGIPLPRNLAQRLEECMNRMNQAPEGSEYCHACDDLAGKPQESQQESAKERPSKPSEAASEYGNIHATRNGKSGIGAFAAVGGISLLGFILSRGKHAAGIGGVAGGGGSGGGGAAGLGFGRGGTSNTPPLASFPNR